MHDHWLVRLGLVLIPLMATRLAAEAFVCAGHAVPPDHSEIAAKWVDPSLTLPLPSPFEQVTLQDEGSSANGTAFFDWDNDGDLDLVTTAVSPQARGDELYQNQGETLLPVGRLLNLVSAGRGRALSAADYDGDGDLDLLVADEERSRLYCNQADQHHWLQVDLEGLEFNRHGLGARVELAGPGQHQLREVQSGYGYCSQVPPRLHFGLGPVTLIDTLRVIWPDGQDLVQTGISADQHLKVRHPGLITAVLEEQVMPPARFQLLPNYPNPFNARTTISYQLPQRAPVKLSVYNIAGQPVKQLVAGRQEAGRYQVFWEGRDALGERVGSGVYFYRLDAGGYQQTRRLLLLK